MTTGSGAYCPARPHSANPAPWVNISPLFDRASARLRSAGGAALAGPQPAAQSSWRGENAAWPAGAGCDALAGPVLAGLVLVIPEPSFAWFVSEVMAQYPYPPPELELLDGEAAEPPEVVLAVTGLPELFSTYQVPPKLVCPWPLATPAAESPTKV